MPTKTLYMNKTTGAMMITNYVSNASTREATMASRLANPNASLSKVNFHSDFAFLKVEQELSLSSASFSSVARASLAYDTSSGCC